MIKMWNDTHTLPRYREVQERDRWYYDTCHTWAGDRVLKTANDKNVAI